MKIINIDAGLIYPSMNSRTLHEATVDEIASSIQKLGKSKPGEGLIHALYVRAEIQAAGSVVARDGFTIIAGHHRYAALRKLKWEKIPCTVSDNGNLEDDLAEAHENLCRKELTPVERAMAIKRCKAIYEELHPEAKWGGTPGKKGSGKGGKEPDSGSLGFAKDTAKAIGQDYRRINEVAARGKALENELPSILGTSLDKSSELDALANMTPEERAPLVAKAKAGEKVSAKKKASRPLRVDGPGSPLNMQPIAEKLCGKYSLDELKMLIAELREFVCSEYGAEHDL